jgi:uncharacterized membrane protein YphA (DoxX/SURF4 family)
MNMLLVLKVAACVSFVLAGGAKLARMKALVDQFHDFKLPPEIMYFIGVVEVLAAVCLWIELLTLWAFSGLACLMVGAMMNHFKAKHPLKSYLPALALLCLCVAGALLAA